MSIFSADFDLEPIREVGNRMTLLGRLLAVSLNNTAQHIEREAVEETTSRLNLDRSYIKDKFSVGRATPAKLVAEVRAANRPVQLRRYDARQEIVDGRRAGISVKVLRSGPRKTIRHAFFGRLRNGEPAVMARVGKTRTPLRVLYSPSPGQVFKTLGPEFGEEAMRYLLREADARTRGLFDPSNASYRVTR